MKTLNVHSREKIRSLRKKQGMTLKDLAQNINCSAGYLSRVETGVVNPSLATLMEIADAVVSFQQTRKKGYALCDAPRREKNSFPQGRHPVAALITWGRFPF